MKEFFAHMYEWFGLIHPYTRDMDDFLRGWDYACVGYYALPWYFYTGILMIIITVLVFALQYDLVSGRRFKKIEHWELAALIAVVANFLIAFIIPATAILKGNHCPLLKLTVTDSLLFGVSNAVWSLILFSMLSLVRRFGPRG
jgi:uncharacterized membrane protein